jgi:hypothetical protein
VSSQDLLIGLLNDIHDFARQVRYVFVRPTRCVMLLLCLLRQFSFRMDDPEELLSDNLCLCFPQGYMPLFPFLLANIVCWSMLHCSSPPAWMSWRSC